MESKIYTEDFYKAQQEGSILSAKEVVPLVLKLIQPKSVVDVGCGVGTWLKVFKELGVKHCLGIDGTYVNRQNLLIPQEEFLPFDLKQPIKVDRIFDLVVSLEVAEHLPEECAKTFVKSLTQLGEVILFSAAVPFQGGAGHINEQWPHYWVQHFYSQGYLVADCLRKNIWNNHKVEFWYAQNILFFIKQDCLYKYPSIEIDNYFLLDLIHPKLYLSNIGYLLAKSTHPTSQKSDKVINQEPIQVNTEKLNTNQITKPKTNLLNVGNSIANKARIDIVLQATGRHGWSFSRGWVNVLQREGLLNRVFAPVAAWGAEEPLHDDGLFEYLKNPEADIIIMPGFDWHSQPLHKTIKWQERWHQSPIIKIALLQECYSAEVVQNTPTWQNLMHQAITNTVPCVDALICNHEPDVDFLKKNLGISVPTVFLPFYIDAEYFKNQKPFTERLNRALFRGNAPRHFTENTYKERSKLIEALSQDKNVDLFSNNLYGEKNSFEVMQEYVHELNAYQILLNLPSLAPTFTVRPFEIMACGGLLLQNRVIGEQSNLLFKDWEHLVYYDADQPENLIEKIEYLIANPDLAQKIAEKGQTLCHQFHTTECRINTILEWINNNLQTTKFFNTSQVVNSEDKLPITNLETSISLELPMLPTPIHDSKVTVIVDGVFFQLYQTGIARVWQSLLEEWANNGFSKHIIVLDRAGTAPKIPGIKYLNIPAFDYNNTVADREMLQQLCDQENADLFISSYYTTPTTTPSVFMAYDMIPEVMGWDMKNPMWQTKHHGIQHASAYIAISENTVRDLVACFDNIPLESVTVAYCGVSSTFSPAKLEEIHAFKYKYGITKPYFLLVGAGSGYKNSILFFQAFSKLASSYGFDIVFTGSGGVLSPEFRVYTLGSAVHMVQLSDEELARAYSGAVALVYPSKYEGFGMPVLEAMACGCPVITCPNASIPEVAGEAAIYVRDNDVDNMENALCDVQKPAVRNSLITAGLAQAKKFSWTKMAQIVSSALIDATLLSLNLREINLIVFPDWSQSEELISLDLEQVIKAVASYSDSHKTTLLINTENISTEDAELFLSSVTMSLLMQEDLDISEELEISFVGNLADIQWETLLSRISAKIALEYEDNNTQIAGKLETIRYDELESFKQARDGQFFFQLGNKHYSEEKWQETIEQYQSFLGIHPGDAVIYWRLSQCYGNLNLLDESFKILQQGIKLFPTDGNLHFTLITNLRRNGRIQEAIASAEYACQCLPEDYTFQILKYLTVPAIYNNQDEIEFYRQRYIQGLKSLIEQTSLKTLQERNSALAGIGRLTNFYLSYQAQNDLDLQRQYGKLVHEIMAANFPQWVVPLSMPKLQANQKIRVGYVSHYLHSYSGTLWLTGWLRYCNHQNFEIYCYYIGNEPDPVTQQFQNYSDVFHHIPYNLTAVCEQILADKLHILVFPEIGMNPQTMQMAALRLAPVQCTAWGHPVTTGLSTIDYFLSSELMEPENAQAHYSETLIRLPNIGVSYPKPYIPPVSKTRADFQLPDDAIIYLCCQAPFKYLPQYDFIFAEIARRIPQAKFLFLRGTLLQQRLKLAFEKIGLNSEDYCIFLSIPERLDYLMINLLADVYLDTFTWSGGNTSLEAIACNLPIVTCPGEFMRGRHSDSFLKMLEITDTIAKNEAEYIEIAVKLGLDTAWRHSIKERMSQSHDLLFDDKVCVTGLEAFYKQVVETSS